MVTENENCCLSLVPESHKTKSLCNKFIERYIFNITHAPNDFKFADINNVDNFIEQLENALTKKTCNVFLIQKYFEVDQYKLYSLAVNTYCKSIKDNLQGNPYYYDEDTHKYGLFYSHDCHGFFVHHKLTDNELTELSIKLVEANGLFLLQLYWEIRHVPEILTINEKAVNQNPLALQFCNMQSLSMCERAVEKEPDMYRYVDSKLKSVEMLESIATKMWRLY